jgi:hypothetical protein
LLLPVLPEEEEPMSSKRLLGLLPAVVAFLAATALAANAALADGASAFALRSNDDRQRIATFDGAAGGAGKNARSGFSSSLLSETPEPAQPPVIPEPSIDESEGAFSEYTDTTAIDPNAVYWLEDLDGTGETTTLAPALGVPNAVSARSFNATPITPNVPLYVGALVVLASGLWAAVYRLGRRRV